MYRPIFLGLLAATALASAADAQCVGQGGFPFNCASGATPGSTDLFLGGSASGQNTVKFTGLQIATGLFGLVPQFSGGGTVNYLRADGTWATPPSGVGTVTDGTHTVSGVGSLTFSGATVSGSGGNATVAISGGAGGTVTSAAVATANGFSGTVANPTTTPTITITVPVTGLLKGNGTGVSAATAGTDFLAPSGSGAGLTGLTFGQLNTTPTTLSGYGITNGLATGNNLSDLSNAPTARTNLGLGTMATQPASAVAVTGGTITNTPVSGAPVAASGLSNAGYNLSQLLGSPFRQPTANDDVTRGNFPSMVWHSNNATWVNISNGAGQAVWQKVEQLPLPGDAIGLFVSAATVHSGAAGSGYVANDTITLEGGVVIKVLTVSSGAIATISVTTPNMYGVCTPTTSAAPQLVTSGSGTGATFDLTVLYPTIYSVRRVSSCFTGSLMEVENSVTTQTKNIGYLSDNSMDFATANAFGTGGAQMEQYANYNDGATPNVAIWYDQGGNPSPNNATQTTVAQQPVLFAGRKIGNSVAVLFNSQGNPGSGLPYPSSTSMVIPAGVTLNSTNAALFAAGGDINDISVFVSLTQNGGTGNSPFEIADSSGDPGCLNSNSAGTAPSGGPAAPVITESPSVYGCLVAGGSSVGDSTYVPAPSTQISFTAPSAGTNYSFQVNAGANCPVPTNHAISYTATGSDTQATVLAHFLAAINSDPTFALAGITAATNLLVPSQWATLYQSVGSACAFTLANINNNGAPYTNGVGFTYQGGFLGASNTNTSTGYMYEGFVAIVPWAVPAAQAQRVRQSVHYHFGLDGHIGAVIDTIVASNVSGYLTPFLQDSPAELQKLLGRDDIVVINKSGPGTALTSVAPGWSSAPWLNNPLVYFTSGKQTNNLLIINGEVNSLLTTGSSAAEYAAIQTIAGHAHTAGWKAVCAGSYQANFTQIASSEMVLLQGLLGATPGACDVVFNPTSIPAFDIVFPGPWNWPYFVKNLGSSSGTHTSAIGNALQGTLAAETIRGMLQ